MIQALHQLPGFVICYTVTTQKRGQQHMAFFTNQAQLRYGNEVANSNITVGEIQEVLAVTKTAVKRTQAR